VAGGSKEKFSSDKGVLLNLRKDPEGGPAEMPGFFGFQDSIIFSSTVVKILRSVIVTGNFSLEHKWTILEKR